MSVVEISTATPVTRRAEEARTLGKGLLTALVVGSMIGAGVFSLPQNMAAKAGPSPFSSAGRLRVSECWHWRWSINLCPEGCQG